MHGENVTHLTSENNFAAISNALWTSGYFALDSFLKTTGTVEMSFYHMLPGIYITEDRIVIIMQSNLAIFVCFLTNNPYVLINLLSNTFHYGISYMYHSLSSLVPTSSPPHASGCPLVVHFFTTKNPLHDFFAWFGWLVGWLIGWLVFQDSQLWLSWNSLSGPDWP